MTLIDWPIFIVPHFILSTFHVDGGEGGIINLVNIWVLGGSHFKKNNNKRNFRLDSLKGKWENENFLKNLDFFLFKKFRYPLRVSQFSIFQPSQFSVLW
jgi:hypothetical protein